MGDCGVGVALRYVAPDYAGSIPAFLLKNASKLGCVMFF